MKKLLEENETLTQIVFDRRPNRTDSPIYKPKFSSKIQLKRQVQVLLIVFIHYKGTCFISLKVCLNFDVAGNFTHQFLELKH